MPESIAYFTGIDFQTPKFIFILQNGCSSVLSYCLKNVRIYVQLKFTLQGHFLTLPHFQQYQCFSDQEHQCDPFRSQGASQRECLTLDGLSMYMYENTKAAMPGKNSGTDQCNSAPRWERLSEQERIKKRIKYRVRFQPYHHLQVAMELQTTHLGQMGLNFLY